MLAGWVQKRQFEKLANVLGLSEDKQSNMKPIIKGWCRGIQLQRDLQYLTAQKLSESLVSELEKSNSF